MKAFFNLVGVVAVGLNVQVMLAGVAVAATPSAVPSVHSRSFHQHAPLDPASTIVSKLDNETLDIRSKDGGYQPPTDIGGPDRSQGSGTR